MIHDYFKFLGAASFDAIKYLFRLFIYYWSCFALTKNLFEHKTLAAKRISSCLYLQDVPAVSRAFWMPSRGRSMFVNKACSDFPKPSKRLTWVSAFGTAALLALEPPLRMPCLLFQQTGQSVAGIKMVRENLHM